MNAQSDRHHWFVLLAGKRHGPYTYDDLTRAAKEGLITADTHIWRSGWKNWHHARSVKGLVDDRVLAIERQPAQRAMNEAPLAPDDTVWSDEQVRAPEVEAFQYAPPQHREARRSQDPVALRWERQPPEDKDDIFADEWRMLAEQRPGQDRVKTSVPARVARKAPAAPPEFDADDMDHRLPMRDEMADRKPFAARVGAVVKRTFLGLGAILLLAGGGWVLLKSGAIQGLKLAPGRAPAFIAAPDLPSTVANVPAVMTLQRNDPAAFDHFKKRFADTAANARDDQVMTLARNALRKSVKHLLAISPGGVRLEITETSLAYLQGLQAANNPESCVWLSDDNKGAKLTSNLAKDLPMPFIREMSVLERIAGTNPHMVIAPMSDEEARPYFEKVISTLRRENVKTELQARDRLDPSEFAPYCALVIAFYQAVLDLPRDDKVNVLRNLYAKAAVNADSDLKR